VAGESAGIPAQPTSGSIDVDEFYGEISIPILEGMFLAQYLEVSAAVRYSDYDLFDDTITQFGINWRPINDLLVRATASEGFRAPSIGELFGSAARFDQTLTDPCSDMLGLDPDGTGVPQPQQIIDNCVSLGVPANGSYTQFNPQISTATGGNDTLTPETADSFTVGIVYAPEWATDASWSNGVELEVTYWDHEVENAIQAFEAQIQLDGCVAAGDPNDFLCSGIGRTNSGVINAFDQKLTNIGGIETSGWDINLIWTSPEFGIGQFVASWYNTILDEYTEILPVSATEFGDVAREGTENGDPERAWPELRSTFILDWMRSEWGASWTVRYLDEVTERCSGGAEDLVPSPCSDPPTFNKLDSVVYNDVQVNWRPGRFDDNFVLTVGVNNLFDEDPPACYSCALNGFDGNVYDIPGQFYYARLIYKR
jgi:iron complex outermembrane receptor protein